MRRLLAAAAALMCAGAACAQGPTPYGQDYGVSDPLGLLTDGNNVLGDTAQRERAAALRALQVEITQSPRELQLSGGKNVDGSWFDEIVRGRGRVDWDDLFHDNTGRLVFGSGLESCSRQCDPYLGVLNALCFLDALTPAHVGPDMGPRFKEPPPTDIRDFLYPGFFR